MNNDDHSELSDLSVIDFNHLFSQTDGVTTADKYRLRRELKKLQAQGKKHNKKHNKRSPNLDAWLAALDKSVEHRSWRKRSLPPARLDPSLPIFEHQQQLIDAIKQHQIIIVCGETGSGKSTQLPLIALNAGIGVDGLIGHTQPRRIAARSVAARIASHLKTPLGTTVGYKIRFSDQTDSKTFVKLMTDGILLAETQSDSFLNQYSMIIVDEAHERSLNIDFLLGNIKRLLLRRTDLKLIITSATIDTARFAEHFCDKNEKPAPVFNIEGRTYPVETRYYPCPGEQPDNNADSLDWLVDQTCETLRTARGDILVFLPTEQDIRLTHKKLRGSIANTPQSNSIDILPLYARLSTEQQNAIFEPGKNRRVVLATNVAESSVTVPRITCVIDSGTARISRYSPRSKVQRLPIEPVSQASANQRAGRCGRIGPGICIRLYSQQDFESRPEFTTPEIRRTNLASVILQSKILKLGSVEQFPFIDPPRADAIRDGFKTLFEIGAVDQHHQLTTIGRKMGRLPVDPRIGRMIFAADQENCLAEILIIAAALEIQDPRIRPAEKRAAADEQHQKFKNDKSDFMSLLKLWDFFQQIKSDLSRSKLQKACQQNYLSYPLMRQWLQLEHQLKKIVQDNGLQCRSRSNNYDNIHRSLLTGLLSGVAMLSDKFEYTGAGGVKFRLWPGSAVFTGKPKWIVAAEIVETNQRYGRTVAQINPDWLEPIAEHLVKSTYSQPHWSRKRQTVLAHQRVNLFGLPIVLSRRVPYGPIDPETCRTIFIEQGLVANDVKANFNFLVANQQLLEKIKNLAEKTRSRDLIVDDYAHADFYFDQLPDEVFDVQTLRARIKKEPDLDRDLRLTQNDVIPPKQIAETASPLQKPVESVAPEIEFIDSAFPDQVSLGPLTFPVKYKYAPGDEQDGVTIQIPQPALGQIDEALTPWLIPGLVEPRIISLIRSLPKTVRRNLVPAPDTAKAVAHQLKTSGANFYQAVAEQLSKRAGISIDASMFDMKKIDDFLKINIQVIDENGETVGQDRSINRLRQKLGVEHDAVVHVVQHENWNQDGIQRWQWDEIPKQIILDQGAAQVPLYPALIDQNDSVGTRLMDSPAAADFSTKQGLVRLFHLQNRKIVKSQINWLPELDRLTLLGAGLFDAPNIKPQLGDLIVRLAFVENQKLIRSAPQFDAAQSTAVEKIGIATQEIAKWLPPCVAQYHDAVTAIDKILQRFQTSANDIKKQMSALKTDQLLQTTPWRWLKHYPRYYSAISARIEKLPATPAAKEAENIVIVSEFFSRFEQAQKAHQSIGLIDPELIEYRWMIEEFRVSLFAQQLGTSQSVSPQRLEKQWKKVRSYQAE